jgi:hypothetical protein
MAPRVTTHNLGMRWLPGIVGNGRSSGAGNRSACPAQFRARMAQLADTGRLRCPDHMNSEGDGIMVIKATCGLRAYGWFCHVSGRRAFVISHVVLKRRQRADPVDIETAVAQRRALGLE